MCIICGEAIAVTTEGTCAFCDGNYHRTSQQTTVLLFKMAGLVLLLWLTPVLAAGAIASM
jgi:predicted nucleic acid-binding Zn ribbon protein